MNIHNSTPLLTALKKYKENNITSFDVPGHKKKKDLLPEFSDVFGEKLLAMDPNSMKELDILTNPTGVIKEAEDLMAKAYNADHSFFLVNGTSSGVQAMIMSALEPGEKIILPRNAHKSAINALILASAEPIYIQPEINIELGISTVISIDSVRATIEKHPDTRAIFLMNPNYYGAISDLRSIIDLAHSKGILVLVDEAHGAHLAFSKELPSNATSLGADMAAVSLHKTGGSLTQSSVLLLNSKNVTYSKVKTMLNLTQTTSASYILMASLDVARKKLALEGESIFKKLLVNARRARKELNQIKGVKSFSHSCLSKCTYAFDETKLAINVNKLGLTGFEVYDILRDEYNIQMELSDTYNVLAILSIGDTWEDIEKLINAMKDIASRNKREPYTTSIIPLVNPEVVIMPRKAFYSNKKTVSLRESIGMISGESIMAYPPGIPILTPGERITSELIEFIELLKDEKTVITGLDDTNIEKIKILDIEL